MEIARENLASVRASNLEVLLVRHWQEIAHFKDIPLDVDWAKYELLEEAQKLRFFTARVAGELVGYAVYLVDANSHYKGSVQAIQDVLFLAPEYRGSSIGARLIKYADSSLAAEGVQVVLQHSKVAHPIDALLARQGYELVERIWVKRVDRNDRGRLSGQHNSTEAQPVDQPKISSGADSSLSAPVSATEEITDRGI